jgi:hypothetical protein
VLTKAQTFALGTALHEIQETFTSIYGQGRPDMSGMHAEFIVRQRAGSDPMEGPVITMEKLRPYQGWR